MSSQEFIDQFLSNAQNAIAAKQYSKAEEYLERLLKFYDCPEAISLWEKVQVLKAEQQKNNDT